MHPDAAQPGDPVVTVIIATYHQPQLLRLALASVLNQEFTAFELWVIGDGCTDDSEQVVRSFDDPRIFWHNLAQNSGSPSAPYNAGCRRARGRYIAYLGHDDLWFPWHLSMLVAAAAAPAADLACGWATWVSPGPVLALRQAPVTETDRFTLVPLPNQFLHARALIAGADGLAWRDPRTLITTLDVQFWWDLRACARHAVAVPRLSSLHFPSETWRAYEDEAERPQVELWQALSTDPAALERRLLDEQAQQAGALAAQPVPLSQRLLRPVKGCYRWLIQTYGLYRWPVRPFLMWRLRRYLRRNRRLRGLPPLPQR